MLANLIIYNFGALIDIINIPFDNGANKLGSKHAYNTIKDELNFLPINTRKIIKTDTHLTTMFGDGFSKVSESFDKGHFPLCIGGDHSVAISSIFAANTFCSSNKELLGVLWFDAHADFNTMKTSPSFNLHGMPVSILCGHDLYSLSYGYFLDPCQFAYYGLRDIDSSELDRFQNYKMRTIDNKEELKDWIDNFDAIHLSFDMDCLDPSEFKSVNTAVKNGPSIENIYKMIDVVKDSKKLISMDLVEYNPTIEINNNVIINLLKKVFL